MKVVKQNIGSSWHVNFQISLQDQLQFWPMGIFCYDNLYSTKLPSRFFLTSHPWRLLNNCFYTKTYTDSLIYTEKFNVADKWANIFIPILNICFIRCNIMEVITTLQVW